MIRLNDIYSVAVYEKDGDHVYQLLDGVDEVVAERVAGSDYTASEEGMRHIGEAMLAVLEGQVRPHARRVEIVIDDDEMTFLQAVNLAKNCLELKPAVRREFKFKNGKRALVRRRLVRSEKAARFVVRFI